MLNKITTTLTASTLLLFSGCGDSASPSQEQSPSAQSTDQPAADAWVLTTAPQGAVSVTDAKATAQEGDQVIIRGRIGGRRNPISADSPVFTLVDLDLEYCGQSNDDQCGTPWDYCCETPTTIVSNSATVQILGDSVDLTGSGLEPLDEVILIGTVGPRPEEQILTIRATGIFKVVG